MATEPVIQEKVYEEIQQEIGDVCITKNEKKMNEKLSSYLG